MPDTATDPQPEAGPPATPTFHPAVQSRRGSPRAILRSVKAKLVHTAAQGRRIEFFVSRDVMHALRWTRGGTVAASWSADAFDTLILALRPAHTGARIGEAGPRTTASRIVVSGSFIGRSMCAAIAPREYRVAGDTLLVDLPATWLSRDHWPVRACAAAQTSGEARS